MSGFVRRAHQRGSVIKMVIQGEGIRDIRVDEGGSERHFGYRSWWKESNLKGQVNDMQNLEPNKRIMGKGATFNALSGKLLSKDISSVGMTSAAKANINEGEERCNLMDVELKSGQAGVIGPLVAN
ncbi:hypothetical protein QYF36_007666 [Acer negundo]|nr:hypothetical protein QYF36_007666 [Acer negundo]